MCNECGDLYCYRHPCVHSNFYFTDISTITSCSTISIEDYEMAKPKNTDEVVTTVAEAPIIKKQAEVWVYEDQVYASYELALAASLKSAYFKRCIEIMYPGSTAATKQSTFRSWLQNPRSYSIYADVALTVMTDLFKEQAKK